MRQDGDGDCGDDYESLFQLAAREPSGANTDGVLDDSPFVG